MPDNTESMTLDEVATASRQAFLDAERHAYAAAELTRNENIALSQITNALASIAYGLKIQSHTTKE